MLVTDERPCLQAASGLIKLAGRGLCGVAAADVGAVGDVAEFVARQALGARDKAKTMVGLRLELRNGRSEYEIASRSAARAA
jgi:hypothetical protein